MAVTVLLDILAWVTFNTIAPSSNNTVRLGTLSTEAKTGNGMYKSVVVLFPSLADGNDSSEPCNVILFPAINSIVSCPEVSFNNFPVRNSGPFVSNNTETTSCGTPSTGTFVWTAFCKLVHRNSTSSGVACEKFNRIQFNPAWMHWDKGISCSDVGPIVATIFTSGRRIVVVLVVDVEDDTAFVVDGSGKSNVVFMAMVRVIRGTYG